MSSPSNQSVLRKLLAEIEDEDGTFTYDEKEAKEIDWTAYDRAQINEINDVLKAIRDVVDQAVKNLNMRERHDEELKKPGRPSAFPGDLAKAILVQQYFHTSNRVAQGLIRLFKEKMGISDTFSYKSIERAYGREAVEEILREVFNLTQQPVRDKETAFSTDGTGFPTSVKYNYEREKYGNRNNNGTLDQFEQAVITCGVKYQVIAHVTITMNPRAGEGPYLESAVSSVSKRYQNLNLWSADSAYLSRKNTSLIGRAGAKPRIYPKKHDTFLAKGSPEWKHMHYDFVENPQKWLREYHGRSISETVNSAFLRMFPRPLTRRLRNRRTTESFTRNCVYNIRRTTYLRYLADITLEFGTPKCQ